MKNFLALLSLLALVGCQTSPPVYSPLPVPPPPKPPASKAMYASRRLVRPLMVIQAAAAPSISLSWDESPDPSVGGYNIYQGVASATYTSVVGVAPVTNTTVTMGPLAPGTTYFFAATALTTNGLESVYSNEVTYSVPTSVPQNYVFVTVQAAPAISGTYTNLATYVLTNPPAPSLFFKLSLISTNF